MNLTDLKTQIEHSIDEKGSISLLSSVFDGFDSSAAFQKLKLNVGDSNLIHNVAMEMQKNSLIVKGALNHYWPLFNIQSPFEQNLLFLEVFADHSPINIKLLGEFKHGELILNGTISLTDEQLIFAIDDVHSTHGQKAIIGKLIDLTSTENHALIPATITDSVDIFSLTSLTIQSNQANTYSAVDFELTTSTKTQLSLFELVKLSGISFQGKAVHKKLSESFTKTEFDGTLKAKTKIAQQEYRVQLSNLGFGTEELEFVGDMLPSLIQLFQFAGLPESMEQSLERIGMSSISLAAIKMAFSSSRKTLEFIKIDGNIRLFNSNISFETRLPEFYISGALAPGESLKLSKVLDSLTITANNFPELAIASLSLSAEPKTESYGLFLRCTDDISIPIGIDKIVLKELTLTINYQSNKISGELAGVCSLAGLAIGIAAVVPQTDSGWIFKASLAELNIVDFLKHYLSEAPAGVPDLVLKNSVISLSTTGILKLESSIEFDFLLLAKSLNIPPLSGIGQLTLDKLNVDFDSEKNSWAIEFFSHQDYTFPAAASSNASLSNVGIRLGSESDSQVNIACSMSLAGSVSIAEGVDVRFKSLSCNWDSFKSQWGFAGDIDCNLFGTSHQLIPFFVGTSEHTALKLCCETDIPLTLVEDIASATIENFYLAVESRTTVKEGSKTDWAIGGKCQLTLVPLLKDTSAQLSLKAGASGSEFCLSVGALAPLTLDLAAAVQAQIKLMPFAISYGKAKDRQAQWQATGGGSLSLINIPGVLEKYFPVDELTIELGFGSDDVYLKASDFSLNQALPPLRVQLPGDLVIDLGQPAIAVEALSLHFGKDLKLSQQLKVTQLKEINRIFGVNNNGEPTQLVFNPECSSELSISTVNGIRLRLQSPPLSAVPIRPPEADGSVWTQWWQIGDIIKLSIQIPEFAFDTNTGTWSASGGILKEGDIKLPLSPLKWILKQLQINTALIDVIPDAVPLTAPGGDALKLLTDMADLAGANEAGFKDLINKIDKQLKRLPTRFTEYVTAEIPDGFQFDIETSTTGNIKFDISMGAPGEVNPKPIKFMFPCAAPYPEITGVTLKRIALGELFGGSILLLELDGYIDKFPLENLLGACLLPDEIMSKDTANSLSYRIITNDVTALVPAATGIAFPVPVFYAEFGIEYHHLSGLQLQSHFKLPKPEGGFIEAIELLSRLIDFFRYKKYLLHKQKPPENFDIRFTLGENYIVLPDFIECEPLGLTQELPQISAYENVSRLLDAMKTANLGYLIEAIPLRVQDSWIRVNQFDVQFGPLQFAAFWCITTEEEFVNTVLKEAKPAEKLPDNIDDSVLKSLPKSTAASTRDNGFIILLMGAVELGPVAGLHAQIGMSLTGEAGFQTGFRLTGTIAQTLSLQISGGIEADSDSVAIDGAIGLYWQEQPLIETIGKIAVTRQSFSATIKLTLTPYFSMSGCLEIGANGFYMAGLVQWQHGNQPKSGYQAELKIDESGFCIGFALKLLQFDATISIALPGTDGQLFAARVLINISDSFLDSYMGSIKSLAQDAVDKGVNKAYDDAQAVLSKLNGLELSVSGLRDWLPKLCTDIINSINNNIKANTKGWKKPGRPAANKIAKPYLKRLGKLRETASKASDESIRSQLKNDINAILAYNHLKIRIPIPTPWKTYKVTVYKRDLMKKSQVKKLKYVIQCIDKLPGQSKLKISAEQIYNQFPPREQLLGQIHRDLDAMPKIESIGFETQLKILDASNISLTAVYVFKGKHQQIEFGADLGNPQQLSKTLVEQVLAELS